MPPTLAPALFAVLILAACSREPTRAPAAAPAPAPVAVAPASAPPASPAVREIQPPVFASGHAKVGSEKCKACHRPQHASWSASRHAAKGLDCEGCHGGGADYAKVMNDRKASYQVGLVMPKRALCRGCHGERWHDEMYFRAHAHLHPVK